MKISAVIFDLDRMILEDKDNFVTDFEEFAEDLKDSGAQIAIVTSSTWENFEKILVRTGLQEIFDTITTVEEISFDKPDPELFTVTSDKLTVEREDCLVVDDSLVGVEAAHRAGMKVVAILSGEDDDQNIPEADYVVESFAEITPKMIGEL
jgi:beta-phosphoglucomutase-like phosphatase (HAD superfamily)